MARDIEETEPAELYPDESYESWNKKLRRKGELNPLAILFVVAASVYLIYTSVPAILDYFTNGIDVWGLLFHVIILVMGLGALSGGIAMARHSIIYGRLLDSTFEKEIYSRLEPAFEEVGKLRAEYKVVHERMDRMSLNISRLERAIIRQGDLSSNLMATGGTTYIFLMVLSMGIMFFILQFPQDYSPYALTTLFAVWWFGVTSEFRLWKVNIAWVWVVFPIFAVPFIALLLDVIYGIAITIGVLGVVLIIYAISYHTWARYYLEGVTPFSSILDEEKA